MLHEEGHQGVTFVHVSDEGSESEDGGDSDEEEDVTEAEAKTTKKIDKREDSSATTTTTGETSQDSEGVVVRDFCFLNSQKY